MMSKGEGFVLADAAAHTNVHYSCED